MEAAKINTPIIKHHYISSLTVLIACIALFSLDKEMHSAADFLKFGNLVALLIYFTPAFFISLLLFKYFSKKREYADSLTLSLVVGIPLSFVLVMGAFFTLMSIFS